MTQRLRKNVGRNLEAAGYKPKERTYLIFDRDKGQERRAVMMSK
jgi:hypothetical protein